MTLSQKLLVVAAIVCGASAWGQSADREPHIGYLYPAGGQQGAVFRVTAGGQALAGVTGVRVSGDGVRATIIKHYRPIRNLDGDQRREIQRRLREAWQKRWAEELGKDSAPMFPGIGFAGKGAPKLKATANKPRAAANNPKAIKRNAKKQEAASDSGAVMLPEHPLLDNLDELSLHGLANVVDQILNVRKKQLNAQIGEMAVIEVTIDPGAPPGDRELRLETRAGLTNPMCFQVGLLPETCEEEPNDPNNAFKMLPEQAPLDLPVLVNGQIMPGDVDRFRVRAQRGQRLVLTTQARHLMPYLADAVPGWFQATLAVYDAKGTELAFDDDYEFDPDPVLYYEVPEDGEYTIEIHDSIYRGREDFVYRIAIGELPFITAMSPLGGRTGDKTVASVAGWNLPKDAELPLDTQPGPDYIRQTAFCEDKGISNAVLYAVDALPESREKESNDTLRKARRIKLPHVVNGCIDRPGDVDVFRFKGRAGEDVVAEVYARRLHSPLDSVLRLSDKSGRALESNDDHEDKETGLLTHHADSCLRAKLPEDGTYYVSVSDAQHQGGPAYGYRLRVSPPRPDFALRVTPSSINVPAGRTVPICVYALRKDGFDGSIEILLRDAPDGLTLSGGRIPAGRDQTRMTLTASGKPLDQPVILQLEGRAQIGEETVTRPVVPAEDMMQAFAYRHLVPSQELMVAVTSFRRGAANVQLSGAGPVRIPAGGTAEVQVKTPKTPRLSEVRLELSDPPKGLTLQDVSVVSNGFALTLKADGSALKAGYADNLIVGASIDTEVTRKGPKAKTQTQRLSLGVLPAIPFEIVER